jgi:signal transduction histidine kinase
MKSLIKKFLIPLAFALNIWLTVFGFAALLDSPYTGIRMSVCGDHACVKSVDKGSPADGKVEAGDRVIDVNNLNISYHVFSVEVDYIKSERDVELFWDSEKKLNETVSVDRPLYLLVGRDGERFTVSLTPAHFPFLKVLKRLLLIDFSGWLLLVVAYLVYRKKANETSLVFLFLGIAICTSFAAAMPPNARDLVYPYAAFRAGVGIDFLSALAISFLFAHFSLVFPSRGKVLIRHRWIVKGLYMMFFLLLAVRDLKVFDNTYITTYIPLTVSFVFAFLTFIRSFITEKSAMARKQIGWVILGTAIGLLSYVGLSSLPLLFGVSFISVEISALPVVLIPISIAFAITKYKLMEIDNIIDTAVVYGFTILVLAGAETAFLSFASPYVLAGGKGLPFFSVIAVLLIVFIYVPIRNFVKGIVERLFKRGKYDPEKELQKFTVSLGLCDERSALEKFTAFVTGLLKPSGIVVLRTGEKTASILHASSEPARREGEKILPQAELAWGHIRDKGTCTFGYELSETFEDFGALFTADLENALLVPFITDPGNKTSGYLAILLRKWNETAYSTKDVTLLNAISVNIANIIEAGELRKERDAIEERFRKEKDAVMKELHDGLGNILTGITVTTQAAERMLEQREDKAGELVSRIEEFSSEAMDFLRTGLTVLDNPVGDIGSLAEAVKDRFSGMFESAGVEFNIECSEEAARLRPGAMIAMNLTRILQEALNNVMKHSEAKRVTISLGKRGDSLAVTISDDGKGFQAEARASGFWLTSMKRRAGEIKGSIRIESSPAKGTKITFSVLPV